MRYFQLYTVSLVFHNDRKCILSRNVGETFSTYLLILPVWWAYLSLVVQTESIPAVENPSGIGNQRESYVQTDNTAWPGYAIPFAKNTLPFCQCKPEPYRRDKGYFHQCSQFKTHCHRQLFYSAYRRISTRQRKAGFLKDNLERAFNKQLKHHLMIFPKGNVQSEIFSWVSQKKVRFSVRLIFDTVIIPLGQM